MRPIRPRPKVRPRLVLRVESLEPRQLRAADFGTAQPGLVSVVSTDPAPGATLPVAPPVITVTFSAPIDPTSLGNADVQIDQVGSDGSLNWLFDATEGPGPQADQVSVTPSGPLAPGNYTVILAGGSGITGLDGAPLAGDGVTDQTIATFTVMVPGVTLAQATDLGVLGTTPTAVSDSLDLGNNPSAVDLYKVTVPAGHFWRLGAEVTAQRDGSPLDSALALFDAQGNLIAEDGQGRMDDPADPYLFAGVGAGTYYLGVSGMGNLPGQPGGYDPVAGVSGTVPQLQAGGPFTLHLELAPEDTQPTLETFRVDRADPTSASPTGLTLQLSDAVRLGGQSGTLSQQLNQAIEVVNTSGQVFPVVASGYDESQARISYLFQDPLPPGQYTVKLPTEGELVDLAGFAPVAPYEPAGVLGTFTVPTPGPTGTQGANDLGALLPGAAASGLPLAATLAPGETATFRMVVTFPALYTLQPQYTGGTIALDRLDPDGKTVSLDAGQPGAVNGSDDMTLTPGIYEFKITDTGAASVSFDAHLRVPFSVFESILENGLGQGPALNLMLITPTPDPVSTVGSPPPSQSPSSPSTPSEPAAPSPSISSAAAVGPIAAFASTPPPAAAEPTASTATGAASAAAPAQTPGPGESLTGGASSVLLTFGGSLAGAPTEAADAIATVGPVASGASTVLAASTTGLLQGITYAGLRSSASSRSEANSGTLDVVPEAVDLSLTGVTVVVPTPEQLEDLKTLAQLQWLERLALPLPRWTFPNGPARQGPVEQLAQSTPTMVAGLALPEALAPSPSEAGSVGWRTPVEVGLIAGLAIGFGKWGWRLRRSGTSGATVQTASKCYIPPPSLRPVRRRRRWLLRRV